MLKTVSKETVNLYVNFKFYKKSIVYDKFLFLGIEKHLDSIKQDIFVDVHKKSFDIKFENIGITTIIL